MKRLRTAVIGLGRIGWQFHVPYIANHNGFELIAVADTMKERLEEAENTYSVKGYSDYKQMLDTEEPDLAVVASPTLFHEEHAVAAMEKGVDVFLEKPMAQSLEAADRIISAMERCKRKLMLYQPQRIVPDTLTMRKIMDTGRLGRVYMIKRCFASDYMRRNDWQSMKKYGGGMLNNYGAHIIDEALYLTGSRAKRVSCSLRSIASLGDADDVVKALIETENGVVVDIDINRATAVPFPSWIVMGDRGSAVLEGSGEERYFRVRYFKEEELGKLELRPEMAAPGRSYGNFDKITWHEEKFPLTEQNINYYDKCYEYFALGKEPFVPVEKTREVMRVLGECRKSAGW